MARRDVILDNMTRASYGTGATYPVMAIVEGESRQAIQHAINKVAAELNSSTATGGAVQLKNGVFEIDQTIELRSRVELVGEGDGTELRAASNLGGPVISNAAAGDRFVGLRNLRINGNKSAQSSGSDNHGVYFNLPDTPGAQEFADAYFKMLNVTVVDTKNDGVKLEGRGEGKISLLNVRDVDGIGVNLAMPDCDLNLVSAGNCGLQGFLVTEANNRLSNCKSFYSGRIVPASGHGVHVNGTHSVTLLNCEAQDNQVHGLYAQDSERVIALGFLADSNNAGHNGASDQNGNGIQIDGSAHCTVIGSSRSRGANAREQKYALGIVNGAEYLFFDLQSDGNASGHLLNGWHTNISGRINGYGGMQELTYATNRTINPTLGSYVVLGALTGNITINAPVAANAWTGAQFTIEFVQDGDGGAVITWGSGLVSDFVLNTGANKRGTVTFRYNGTDWLQVGAGATNL